LRLINGPAGGSAGACVGRLRQRVAAARDHPGSENRRLRT
jgi:hypothetical protein